ncbi:MAG: BF3164 family lipoprotein [Cytophagales bacterium]|nr:BF3164 family lipoprotein [Cytophagales bacterium]
MKSAILFTVATSLLFYGCSLKKFDNSIPGYNSVFMKEKPNITLEGIPIGPSDYFRDPDGIAVIQDTILLVTDGKTEDAIHFVNIRTQELIKTYGKIGEGPGELATHVVPMYLESQSNVIELLEPAKKRLATYSIDSLLNGSDSYFPSFAVGPPEIGSPLGMTRIDEENFVINANFPCSRLLKWNSSSDQLDCSPGVIPLDDIDLGQKSNLTYEVMAVRPDQKLIATAMYKYNRIDIYNLELQHQFAIVGDQNSNPFDYCKIINGKTNCEYQKMEKFSSAAIYASQDHIYVSRLVPLSRNPQNIYDHEVVLLVFDWEGNSVGRMSLGRFVFSFTVDEKNKKLYAIDDQLTKQMIIEYNLPDFKA